MERNSMIIRFIYYIKGVSIIKRQNSYFTGGIKAVKNISYFKK